MPVEKPHKIIITGTGRAGTTFLVQLLSELGLDTGYTTESWRRDYHEHCHAGLEHDVEDPASPYIVKNPALCETLPGVLARDRITIDFAFIPIRRLDHAALSRVRVGGDGRTPGGLIGTADSESQKAVLAENFHHLVETLSAHDIPHAFLHFPRFAQDAAYTWGKLQPVLTGVSRAHFDACFGRLARPELIHDFPDSRPADAGQPAKAFAATRRSRRFLRYAGRCAAAVALVGLGWLGASRLNERAPVAQPTRLAGTMDLAKPWPLPGFRAGLRPPFHATSLNQPGARFRGEANFRFPPPPHPGPVMPAVFPRHFPPAPALTSDLPHDFYFGR